MKDFTELSGPWSGMSVQGRRRISETIRLLITDNRIVGDGSDADGRFELTGTFNPKQQRVSLTRRYTVTSEPDQASVGIAFDYSGTWDGMMVSGTWHMRLEPVEGGPFEMWPDRDEDREGLKIQFEEAAPLTR